MPWFARTTRNAAAIQEVAGFRILTWNLARCFSCQFIQLSKKRNSVFSQILICEFDFRFLHFANVQITVNCLSTKSLQGIIFSCSRSVRKDWPMSVPCCSCPVNVGPDQKFLGLQIFLMSDVCEVIYHEQKDQKDKECMKTLH